MASSCMWQHTHWTCHPSSMFGMLWIRNVYDTYTTACSSSHSHWRGVDQHSTGHNQLPDPLYVKEQMVVTPDIDWFSDPPNKAKLHISEWPFIVASLRHTCAIFMLSNQHLDMPHLWGGMDYLGKGEVLTNTDLDRFVNNIWEKWIFWVYRKSFRSLSSALKKWEQKQKCCVYIFVQCM